MQPSLMSALRTRRPRIRARWEVLLRAQPPATPLGQPDALIHLIDWTLDKIFAALADPLGDWDQSRRDSPVNEICVCGRNPLFNYFAAGRQALLDALAEAHAAAAVLDPWVREQSVLTLNQAVRRIVTSEAGAFCGICVHRNPAFSESRTGKSEEAVAPGHSHARATLA